MKKIILTSLLFFTIFCTKAQTFNLQLSNMLQDTLNFYTSMISNIKGMSVSVYIPGQGTWQSTSGVSYDGQPITSDMKFGIASNTKLFVATTMLILAENDIISLDDAIQDWLPDYPNVNPNITIRQLLNHTSGISDPLFVAPWMDTIVDNSTRIFTPEEVLSWLDVPTFPVGTSWGYSNVNYILAGMIAETATGFHISQLIRDSILTPLSLNNTFYDVEEGEQGPVAHRWWNTVDYNDTSRVGLNTAGGCAGSLFSTASDMAQWYAALFSGQIINESSMGELTNFVATTAPTSQYGLGISRENTQGYSYWGHGGTTWGYRSKMIYDSCLNVVVCGLTNSYPSGMEAVTFLLYRVVKNHIPGCSGAIEGLTTFCQGTNAVNFSIDPIPNAISYQWTLPSGATGTSETNSISIDFGPNAVSGNVIVSGVNEYGIGGTSSLWITVNPIPETPVITQVVNTLISSAMDGNQWYNSLGTIEGENQMSYVVSESDDYYTIVTLLGCTSEASNTIHVIVAGMENVDNKSGIAAFPNPSTDIFVVEGESINSVDVLNLAGQLIYSVKANNTNVILDLSEFSSGVYFAKIHTNDGIITRQLIKE